MIFRYKESITRRLGLALLLLLLTCLHPLYSQTIGTDNAMPDKKHPGVALKTNLFYDLALMPNLGAEFHFGKGWSLLADYTWANYKFDSGNKRYAISQGSAEIRHYMKDGAAEWPTGFYLGLYGLAGNYNFKFSETGRQGNHLGIGLSAGYQVRLSHRWFIDLGASAGWLHVSNGEKYHTEENLSIWKEDYTKNGFAPLSLRAALVFNLSTGKKGGNL